MLEKEEWTSPEVEEFDITERTQAESFGGTDSFGRGPDLDGGEGESEGGSGGGGASPSS